MITTKTRKQLDNEFSLLNSDEKWKVDTLMRDKKETLINEYCELIDDNFNLELDEKLKRLTRYQLAIMITDKK